MSSDHLVIQLTSDVRALFEADPRNAPQRIERMLESRLAERSAIERQQLLGRMIRQFQSPPLERDAADQDIMARVCGLLLGRRVTPEDLSSAELLERLAQSLNTIFDTLNKLISVINMSFSRDGESEDQTIRQFIGFHLEGEDQTQTLETYLGQISQAFLNTHEAFKKAAHKQVERILLALDMDQVAKERGSGLKIGPLRKAEDYQILMEKIERIRKWFNSGRCTEDFLREFEKNCQSLTRK